MRLLAGGAGARVPVAGLIVSRISAPMLASLAFAIAPSAAAQDDVAAIDRTYSSLVAACLAGHNDTGITAATREKACRDDLGRTDAHFASLTSPSLHEANVYRMHRAFLLVEIGGAYLFADGMRSQRACAQTEAGWDEMTRIIPGSSPAGHQADFRAMRANIGSAIEICRRDFGTPPGAVPVR